MTLVLVLALVTQAAAAQSVERFQEALVASWTGTLEYRDYRSDRRVTLPTRLIVESGAPGQLTFAYTYDDGPGKTVRSQERITIDRAASTYRIQNGDGNYDATFAATGLAAFGSGSPTIVLIGKGDENGAPVDLRITLTVTASSFTMLRESRKAGEDWLFRNQYKFTR
jgi:hypothetical protein